MDNSPRARIEPRSPDVAATGIAGLDDVLRGGLTPHRLYLVEGLPGSGKTTVALQFLLEGVRRGEPVLYVTLSETEEELRGVAASHGWSLDGVTIRELSASEGSLKPDEQYTMFHPSEVELSETMRTVLAEAETLRPARVVFDSLAELRLLAGNSLRYRRQILALKHFFVTRDCTVLLLDDSINRDHDDSQVRSVAHGVVRLEQLYPEYGAERRRMTVVKFRGVRFRGGYHDYLIRRGGLEVFPRLVAAEHALPTVAGQLSSGIPEFDQQLGGGLERGSSTLVVGAPGSGKSSLVAHFVHRAVADGHAAAMFVFDESVQTLVARSRGLGIDLQPFVDNGKLLMQQVDPAELSPGEFVHRIRRLVEQQGVSVVVIDSLNGYLNAMPDERYLTIHLHELLMYLGQLSVTTLMVGAHQGMIGGQMTATVDASYLADTVILLRFFESKGEVRRAISVVKKRSGPHERTIRELSLASERMSVGAPLADYHGVMTGVPSRRQNGHDGTGAAPGGSVATGPGKAKRSRGGNPGIAG